MNVLLFTVCKDNKDVLWLKTESRDSSDHSKEMREGVLFMQLLPGNPNNLLPLVFSLKKWQPCVTRKEKEPVSLQCFFYRTETDTQSLSTIPAFKARNWHVLPKEIKCNENVFLVQVRDCICCIAVYVSWGQHNLLLSAVMGLFKHSRDWFSIALSLGYLYLLLCRSERWPQQMRNFGETSILHSQGTDTNIYFKSGVLISVEKAFLTHVYSSDNKTWWCTFPFLYTEQSFPPRSGAAGHQICCWDFPEHVFAITDKGSTPSIRIRLSCQLISFKEGPVKVPLAWNTTNSSSASFCFSCFHPKPPLRTNLDFFFIASFLPLTFLF